MVLRNELDGLLGIRRGSRAELKTYLMDLISHDHRYVWSAEEDLIMTIGEYLQRIEDD